MTVQTSGADFASFGERPIATTATNAWTLRRVALLFAVLGLAALAVLARIWHTRSTPLWLDEAYSGFAAQHGWGFLWHVVPTYETHPPLYYSMLHVWTGLFGDGLIALRALGYAASFATLGVVWLAAREIATRLALGRWVAPATVLLAAFSVELVEMSREVRPYPVLILVYAIALLGLVRTTRPGTPTLANRWFALYCVAYAVTLWLHSLGPLYGAALGIAALVLVARRDLPAREWAVFFGGHALALLLWVPALLILRDQATGWIRSTWLVFTFDALHWKLMLLWGAPGKFATIPTCALLALGVERIARRGRDPRLAAALVVTMVLPVILAILISIAVTPVFLPRTLTGTTIPALLLSGVAIGGTAGWRKIAALLSGLSVLWTSMAMELGARRGPPPQQWYAAVEWLGQRYRAGDVVLAYPNEGALPFDFAIRDRNLGIPARPVPGPVPTTGYPAAWYPTGSRGVVSLPVDRLQAIAREPGVSGAHTVWLLRLGPEMYDPGDAFLHVLERTRRPVAHFESGPIDLIGLAPKAPLSAVR